MPYATTVMSQYGKTCPDCDGKPFRRIEGSGKVYFGIFKTPDQIICCSKCEGAGMIAPKEVILHPDRLEAEVKF